jgi:hypothetical protein
MLIPGNTGGDYAVKKWKYNGTGLIKEIVWLSGEILYNSLVEFDITVNLSTPIKLFVNEY